MNTQKFADLCKGIFYLVSTVAVGTVLYLVVFIWQPLWTDGFEDFGNISDAIGRLDRTAKPVAEMAPLMLGEMDKMRLSMVEIEASMKTMEEMNPTIKHMNHSVDRMAWIMDQRMGHLAGEMGSMNNRMSPAGMMPFNW